MAAVQSFPLATKVSVPASHWDGLAAVDLFAPCGTPWTAVFDGIAQPIDAPLGGNALLLTAADGTVAYYAHGKPERTSGQVRAGQVIGYVSDSGNAKGTGCHLHFAVGRHGIDDNGAGDLDPAAWLAGAEAKPLGGTEDPGNGKWRTVAIAGIAAVGALMLLDALIGD